jgi:hypothetical protein
MELISQELGKVKSGQEFMHSTVLSTYDSSFCTLHVNSIKDDARR